MHEITMQLRQEQYFIPSYVAECNTRIHEFLPAPFPGSALFITIALAHLVIRNWYNFFYFAKYRIHNQSGLEQQRLYHYYSSFIPQNTGVTFTTSISLFFVNTVSIRGYDYNLFDMFLARSLPSGWHETNKET